MDCGTNFCYVFKFTRLTLTSSLFFSWLFFCLPFAVVIQINCCFVWCLDIYTYIIYIKTAILYILSSANYYEIPIGSTAFFVLFFFFSLIITWQLTVNRKYIFAPACSFSLSLALALLVSRFHIVFIVPGNKCVTHIVCMNQLKMII